MEIGPRIIFVLSVVFKFYCFIVNGCCSLLFVEVLMEKANLKKKIKNLGQSLPNQNHNFSLTIYDCRASFHKIDTKFNILGRNEFERYEKVTVTNKQYKIGQRNTYYCTKKGCLLIYRAYLNIC